MADTSHLPEIRKALADLYVKYGKGDVLAMASMDLEHVGWVVPAGRWEAGNVAHEWDESFIWKDETLCDPLRQAMPAHVLTPEIYKEQG